MAARDNAEQYSVKNSKGLFGQMRFAMAVMTKEAHAAVKRYAENMPEGKEKKAAMEMLDLVEQLPFTSCWSVNKTGSLVQEDAYGWVPVDSFVSASSLTEYSSPEACGWHVVGKIQKHVKLYEKLMGVCGQKAMHDYYWRGASGIARKVVSEGIVFEKFDPSSDLADADAWALYCDGRGYLDSKGGFGPIARARMFESAEACKRTSASRGISSSTVVRVNVKAAGIENVPGTDTEPADLRAALAKIEAEALAMALEKADIETLRARLAVLEAEECAAPAQPKTRKPGL